MIAHLKESIKTLICVSKAARKRGDREYALEADKMKKEYLERLKNITDRKFRGKSE